MISQISRRFLLYSFHLCCCLAFFGSKSNHVFCNDNVNGYLYFKPNLSGGSKLVHQKQKCDCFWRHTQSQSYQKLFFEEATTLSFYALLQNPTPLFQAKISLQILYPRHGMAGLHVPSSFLTLFYLTKKQFVCFDLSYFLLVDRYLMQS